MKLKSKDGKYRETDVLDTKGILRLIESVPSPKAEPFKVWLANLGNERINEVFNPEIMVYYLVCTFKKAGLPQISANGVIYYIFRATPG